LGTEEEYDHCVVIEQGEKARKNWANRESGPGLFGPLKGGRRTHKKRQVSTTRRK
jgi:hypothetical protein